MFDMKANNVKVGDKLVDTQNRVWAVDEVDESDTEQPYFCTCQGRSDLCIWFLDDGVSNLGDRYEIVGFAPEPIEESKPTANKPHKHKDLIIAWANGAEIECFNTNYEEWIYTEYPSWCENTEYRIKPEPKPDVVKYVFVEENPSFCNVFNDNNLKLTFCGETGKLKSAEVIS